MESKVANQIPISDILEKYGCEIVKSYCGYDMYKSPFREENTASFKVDIGTNRWQDFGEGTFGSAVDLVMRLENCSFSAAMKIFEEKSFSGNCNRKDKEEKQRKAIKQPQLHVLKIAPLTNKILINYAKNRGIDADIVQKYCKEVYYKMGEEGQTCFAIGFENDSGGFEISNPMFKGCTHSKDITCIDNGSDKCIVIEGFFDMLSYQQLMKDKSPELQKVDIVVLNTTALISKAQDFILKHKMIHSFLDNDAAGRNALRILTTKSGREVVDESTYLYPQCKDLNEYLQNSIKKKNNEDIVEKRVDEGKVILKPKLSPK